METKSLNCSFWLHVACAYLTIGLMGLTQLAELVAFPLMRNYFKPTADQYGLATSVFGCCYLLGCFLSTLILKKWGCKTLYVITYLTDTFGCIALQFARSFFWACACIFFITTSLGLFEISTNSVATSLFKKHTATWMMFMQTCFGIGATLSPIICKWGVKFTNSVATSLFKKHTATWMMFMQTCFGIGATLSPIICKWGVKLLHRDFFSCYIMIAIIVSLGFLFICFVDINPSRFNESEEKKVDVVVDGATVQQSISQETAAQQSTSQETAAQQSISQETAVQQSISQETAAQQSISQETAAQQPITQDTTTQKPISQETTTQKPITEDTTTQRPITEDTTTQKPITEDTTQKPITQDITAQETPVKEVSTTKSSAFNTTYSWWTTLSTPMCWLCAATMGMMEGVENGTNSWATLYLVDILHFDPLKEVATFATFLQLIFTISRLISGPIIDWIGYYRSLYFSNIGCMLLLLVGFLTGRKGIYFFVFTSFFYAWFWPTNVCVMMGIFKENAPFATSHIFVMQGLFTFPFGYILGWVNRLCGDQWAYRANLVFGTLALICLTVEYCINKKKENPVSAPLISEEEKAASVTVV
ncbi:variable charge X-linked protein [Blastocystis sp. ATCC 50177/Nand II]|uniref:Variable charge X-linked protein n=1 Tax=Blastocystis sp. subtype 1 (strain ATCC 50177 / NandII) TaxID=478820 RepID=A0A196S9V1_BLAHN|nr:variable charge X-linked protein [Blastocystis sp. ATCC 50177/Nand II]